MACNHAGGPELIEMAEHWLRERKVAESAWPGRRFRWSENLRGAMWASVVVEVERREGQWVVTRLDRNREPVSDPGFHALPGPDPAPS